MSPRWVDLWTGAALVLLFGVVSLSSRYWVRLLREPAPEAEAGSPARATEPEAAPAEATEGRISVKLLFQSPEAGGLVAEERTVRFSRELPQQIRSVVEELARGSETGLVPTLPPETRVLEVFVTAEGVAYVSLSFSAPAPPSPEASRAEEASPTPTAAEPAPEPSPSPTPGVAGSREELIGVYSLVDTLALNFPAVRRVQILIDDRTATTLAGHVDLSRPLHPDMTFLAPLPLEPPAANGPAGEASPTS